jgi:hypothetical protein
MTNKDRDAEKPMELGTRAIKKTLGRLLESGDRESVLSWVGAMPPGRIVSPLFSFLLSTRGLVKWMAVEAMGIAVSRMAEEDTEAARVVMRRLMWQLNDESGGIGWGCPEAMGEIMAQSGKVAHEYAHVLRSYADEEGNFIEYEPLQEGVLWALGRLACKRPDLVEDASRNIISFLASPRPPLRGLALWALGSLKAGSGMAMLDRAKALKGDDAELEIYLEGAARRITVGELAGRILEGKGPLCH